MLTTALYNLRQATQARFHKARPAEVRLLRHYSRGLPTMRRAVNRWLRLVREAILYGVNQQMILGREPILGVVKSEYAPTDLLEKLCMEAQALEILRALSKDARPATHAVPHDCHEHPLEASLDGPTAILKAGPADKILSNIVGWHCLIAEGSKGLARADLRIYRGAMTEAGNIAGAGLRFDVVNQKAVEWAAANSSRLVTAITDETRKALRGIISQGIADGKSTYKIGREIRPLVGLNSRQADAALKLRGRLEAAGLSPSDVTKKVDRYAAKAHRYRADMIARTETARAVSEGTIQGYESSGVPYVRWDAAADSCPICAWADSSVYRLSEAAGLIPAHPSCLVSGKAKIYTVDGWVPIEDIQVGDLVLTHKGRFRKVIQRHFRKRQRPEIVRLRTGNDLYLTVTANHPVLVAGEWRPASEVNIGDRVSMLAGKCPRCGKPCQMNQKFCSLSCSVGYRRKGQKSSDETREKIRQSRLGTTLSETTKRRVAASLRQYYMDHPEARERRREEVKGRKHGPGAKEKVRQAKLGRPRRTETKAKISQALTGRKLPPEHRQAIGRGLTGRSVSKETRRKIKESSKKFFAEHPEVCAKRSRDAKRFFTEHPEKHAYYIVTNRSPNTMTDIERLMAKALSDCSIPAVRNYPVGGRFIDFAVVEYKIAIECDGEFWHQDKAADGRRDKELSDLGWTTLRFPGERIKQNAAECADSVSRLLANHDGEYDFAYFEVVEKKQYYPKKSVPTYNLSVEEDESYIAKGFVVHNCRCVWTPERRKPRLLSSPRDKLPDGVAVPSRLGIKAPK